MPVRIFMPVLALDGDDALGQRVAANTSDIKLLEQHVDSGLQPDRLELKAERRNLGCQILEPQHAGRVRRSPVNTAVDRPVHRVRLVVPETDSRQLPVLNVVVLVLSLAALVLEQPSARSVALERAHEIDVRLPTARAECLASSRPSASVRWLAIGQPTLDNTVALTLASS